MFFLLDVCRSGTVLHYMLQWICKRWSHNRATLPSFVSQALCHSLVTEGKCFLAGFFGGFSLFCLSICILTGRTKVWNWKRGMVFCEITGYYSYALWKQILNQVRVIYIHSHQEPWLGVWKVAKTPCRVPVIYIPGAQKKKKKVFIRSDIYLLASFSSPIWFEFETVLFVVRRKTL